MNVLVSLIIVGVLVLVATLFGSFQGGRMIIGIAFPYLALAVFIVGFIYKIIQWAKIPVPFRIPSTCGQQKSMDWIKHDRLDNPSNTLEVVGRMALEVLFFRSLFKNTKAELLNDKRFVYSWNMWLWLGAIVFHWSFLIVIIRHLRLFADPVPGFILLTQELDGFMQVGVPVVFMTSFGLLLAVTFLFVRRLLSPQVRYISLLNDYFPLMIILVIAATGIWMRHFDKVDIIAIKQLTMGLMTFSPHVPETVGVMFFIHIFFVSLLMAYFPFSKLMHAGGVFMSPTRNLANNSRAVRHINPWNYPVDVHTYEDWEDDFREKMKSVGLPTEKD